VTGKKIWEKRDLKTSGEIASTPAVDGDRVYGMGGDGTLFCLRTSDGKIQWQRALQKEYHLYFSGTALAVSPIVEGNLLLINASDAGAAVNKRTGKLVWASSYPRKLVPTVYASPVPFTYQGKRLVLFRGPEFLSAVEPTTGKALWRLPHDASESISDPVFSDGLVFAVTVAGAPDIAALDLSTGTADIVWKKDVLHPSMVSPVPVNGLIFGTDWQSPVYIPYWAWEVTKSFLWDFRCVDQKTGDIRWSQPLKHSTVTAAGDKLILLDIEGTLRIVDTTPEAYRELCSADVFAGASKPRLFATYPVLCGGRIYCRNYAGDLVCIDVSS
jgi:outer membrane protein assembly factor BamB